MTRGETFVVLVCLIGLACLVRYSGFELEISGFESYVVPSGEYPRNGDFVKYLVQNEDEEDLSKKESKFYCLGDAPRSVCFFENVCVGNFQSSKNDQSWEEIPPDMQLSISTDMERHKRHIMSIGEWASRYLRRAYENDSFEGSGLLFSIGSWPHLYPHVWTNNLNHIFNISSQFFEEHEKLDFYVARTAKASHPYIEWPPNWMRPFLARTFNYRQSFYLDDKSNFETVGNEDKVKAKTTPPDICYQKFSIGMGHDGWHDSLFTDFSQVLSYYHQRVFNDCPKREVSSSLPSVIVVNRTRTKNDGKCKRCFKNYDDINLVLSKMDDLVHFVGAHDFAKFSIQEQICMVQDVTFLVGFHGAGLINAQWMIKRPAWVLEVRFPSRTGAWFGRTSGEFGLHHAELPWESTCAIETAIRANLEGILSCPTTERLRKEGKLTFPDRFKPSTCPEVSLPVKCADAESLMKQQVDVGNCFEYLCCTNPECPYTFTVPAKEMKVG